MLAKIGKRLGRRDENKLLTGAEREGLIAGVCHVDFSLAACYRDGVRWVTLF